MSRLKIRNRIRVKQGTLLRSQVLKMYCVMALVLLPWVAACGNGRTTPGGVTGPSNPGGAEGCPPAQFRDSKGRCANAEVTTYVTCIDGQVQSTSQSEKASIEVGVDTALRVAHADTAVEVARNITSKVDSQVALQIVHDCLELSKTDPNTPPSSKAAIQDLQNELDKQIQEGCKGPGGGSPIIKISPSEGPAGTPITVTGDSWPANIELEITVAFDKVRASSDASGRFSAPITVPQQLANGPNNVDVRTDPVDPLIRVRCGMVTSPTLFKITH
jgi:hypothetical protein